MLLCELFNTGASTSIRTTMIQPFRYMAEFSVGDQNYRYQSYLEDNGLDRWSVEFSLMRKPTQAYPYPSFDQGVTNTGNAVQVFATVKQIMAKQAEKYPDMKRIMFSAGDDEPSRLKLYGRMAQRGILPGWKFIGTINMDDGVQYEFERQSSSTSS